MDQRKIGILLSYASQGVKLLTTLLYTPIMLRLLGQSEYGLYQLVFSVVSYLNLLSFGFGSAYVRFYSRYNVKDDQNGIAKLNGMFLLVFSAISILCVICGAVMITHSDIILGKNLTQCELETAEKLMALMVLNLVITFPSSVFDCIITAHEEFIFQKLLVLVQGILNPFLALPLLLMGYGSVGMVWATTILTIAKFVLNIFFCKNKLKISFCFKQLPFSLLLEISSFTFFIFLCQIIDQINWSVDKFLLGRIVGTTAVSIYGVAAQINTVYLQFSTTISNVFIPKVNQIVATTDDNKQLTRLMSQVGRMQCLVLMLILSGFIFFGKEFISLWAGIEYAESYSVGLLLIVPVTIPLIQNLGIEIQRAKNMHQVRTIVYFIIAIGNIFISMYLIPQYGPTGAAMGTAISLIIGNVLFMNFYYQRGIGLDMVYFWKYLFKLLPSFALPVIYGSLLSTFFNLNTWGTLAIGVTSYAIIYVISLVFFALSQSERKKLYNILHKMVRYNIFRK